MKEGGETKRRNCHDGWIETANAWSAGKELTRISECVLLAMVHLNGRRTTRMRRMTIALGVLLFVGSTAAHAVELGDVEIHGFGSTGYMQSDHNNYLVSSEDGSFEFNEAAVNFSASLTEDIQVGMQLYSFDLGDIGNNDVELDSAFLDYEWKEWLALRAGKFKSPYGLYTEVQDYDMLRTSVLLPQGVYNRLLRESLMNLQGGDVHGKTSLGAAGAIHYDAFAGTFEVDTDGGMRKMLEQGGTSLGVTNAEVEDAKADYVAGCRLKWDTPVDGLLLAATGGQFNLTYHVGGQMQVAPDTILDLDIETKMPKGRVYWYSAEYSLGNLTAAAECVRYKADQRINILSQGAPVMPGQKQKLDWEGYYGLISYRFADWLEAGAYYSVFYNDADDHDGSEQLASGLIGVDYEAWQKDLALSTRFDITDSWLVKLEVHFMDGVALARYTENPEGLDEDWTLYAVKTTFNF